MAVSLAKLGIRPGDRVVDVGCGTGKVAIAASRVAEHVYAIDRRPEAVAYARGRRQPPAPETSSSSRAMQ